MASTTPYVVEGLDTAGPEANKPTNPQAGFIYTSLDESKTEVFDGTEWQLLATW